MQKGVLLKFKNYFFLVSNLYVLLSFHLRRHKPSGTTQNYSFICSIFYKK